MLGASLCFAGLAAWSGEGAVESKDTPRPPPLKPIKPVADWEKDLHHALQRTVTYDFVDVALDDILAAFRTHYQLSIILDPARLKNSRHISLRVIGERLEDVLMRLMREQGLNYKLRDEALFLHDQFAYADEPRAPLPAAQAEALAALIAELNAEDFDVRERASKSIARMGVAAKPALEAALAKAPAAETCKRVEGLLADMRMAGFLAEAPDVAKVLDLLSDPVSLEHAEEPLDMVVRSLGAQARVAIVAEGLANANITLGVRNMKLGNAVRWAARLAGARIVAKGGMLVLEKMER
jgi:hypothetical protein